MDVVYHLHQKEVRALVEEKAQSEKSIDFLKYWQWGLHQVYDGLSGKARRELEVERQKQIREGLPLDVRRMCVLFLISRICNQQLTEFDYRHRKKYLHTHLTHTSKVAWRKMHIIQWVMVGYVQEDGEITVEM